MSHFWIESSLGATEKFPQTSQGLASLAEFKTSPGEATVFVEFIPGMDDEAKTNLVALIHKADKHFRHVLGLGPAENRASSQIWRRYWRNICDRDHDEGSPNIDVWNTFLRANIPYASMTEELVSLTGTFQSAAAAASVAGRMVNAMRWCQKWTLQIRLVSDAAMTWSNFNKLTVDGDQPIVRRKKR